LGTEVVEVKTNYQEIFAKLRFQGLRHRLGLADWCELRQIADEALNAEIYTPSLVDAALDTDARLDQVGAAFEQALKELTIALPESKEDCCWELLRYQISQIERGAIEPQTGLRGVMEVYYGCELYKSSTYYTGDSHDIHYLVGAYWEYDDLPHNLSTPIDLDSSGKDAKIELDEYVATECRNWLECHAV
jgi:hypothetical protein